MGTKRRIEHEKYNFAPLIWDAENNRGRVIYAASLYWTPEYENFLKFWDSCSEIHGLFHPVTDEFLACVYMFPSNSITLEVHLSVVAGVSSAELTDFFIYLKDLMRSKGIWNIRAFVLSINWSLRRILEAAGFHPSRAKMDAGHYRGKVLKWIEYRG